MRSFYPAWCALVLLLAGLPVGWRVLTWPRSPEPPAPAPSVVEAGKVLFNHDWKPKDPLSGGDGLGPVYNATSCVACHNQARPGGAGDNRNNVLTFAFRRGDGRVQDGVLHMHAVSPQYQETPQSVDPALPAVAPASLLLAHHPERQVNVQVRLPLAKDESSGLVLSERNTPALFGAGLIDGIRDREIIANQRRQRLRHGLSGACSERVPVGRVARLPGGRIGRFGWKAQSPGLSDFVQAACANELGLSNPGAKQPAPLGSPGYQAVGYDLTLGQCNQMTAFLAALPRPVERPPANPALQARAEHGRRVFERVGCADCHTPRLGSVDGIYSDLLLHRMGSDLSGEGSSYGGMPSAPDEPSESGPLPDEWRTPPLWGVADSAPYLHDGRARTLEEAIRMHGGQAAGARARFDELPGQDRVALVEFLASLRAP